MKKKNIVEKGCDCDCRDCATSQSVIKGAMYPGPRIAFLPFLAHVALESHQPRRPCVRPNASVRFRVLNMRSDILGNN
eukprot:2603605-Rhodomonas_salina.1